LTDPAPADAGQAARALLRRAAVGALATSLREAEAWPHASLVLVASDHAGEPLLMLSDLAVHSRNMAADPRVSLLVHPAAGDPMAGARATLLARAHVSDDRRRRARFLARHPSATAYAGFADFRLYHLVVERVHVIQGFGRIEWVAGGRYRFTAPHAALVEAEADILQHMNADHGAALEAIAAQAWGPPPAPPTLVGVDPEGFDLMLGNRLERIEFPSPISDPEGARAAFVALARAARSPGIPRAAAS
jgi:putative heme iron utilization protein